MNKVKNADERYKENCDKLHHFAIRNDYFACDNNTTPTDWRIWMDRELKEEKIFHRLEKEYENNDE